MIQCYCLVWLVRFLYLYEHAPALKEKSFAEQMKYENRQFHFDVLMGMNAGTVRFGRYQRAIRGALRQGQYELQECSVSRDSKGFFHFLGKPIKRRANVHRVTEND